MKELENIPTEFFDLLEKKSFEELNLMEKNEVLKKITEQEYKEYHKLISDFKILDEEMEASASDFEKLLEVKSEKGTNSKIYYRMAAAFAILLFASLTYWDINNKPVAIVPDNALADTLNNPKEESTIDSQWLAGRLEMIKQSAESSEKNSGISLANEDYPKDFVLDFGSRTIPGGNLKVKF